MVSTRICHNQQTGLSESGLDLIGECTRSEAPVEGGGTGGRGELQHCSLKWPERTSYSQDLSEMLIIIIISI